MMEVGGSDPRTKTGLFFWPWNSYPAVAANAVAANAAAAQPIMMGASASAMGAAGMGPNMLGMPQPGSGSAVGIEDSFETLRQRFSYSNAHAAHMSHILPHQQIVGTNDNRHLARSRDVETNDTSNSNGNSHQNPSPQSIHHSQGHLGSTQRLLSPQSRSSSNHLHRHTSGNEVTHAEHLGELGSLTDTVSGSSRHAAAIAAFASVAANSGMMGANESVIGSNNLSLPHNMHVSRHTQQALRNAGSRDMVFNGLCNGFGKPNFSSMANVLNRQQSPTLGKSAGMCSKIQPDSIPAYNFHYSNLKDLSDKVALAAAVVGEQAPELLVDPNASSNSNNKQLDRDSGRQSVLDESSRVTSATTEAAYQRQPYLFGPKSPLSDSLDNPSTNDSANAQNALDSVNAAKLGQSNSDSVRSNQRLMSSLCDRPSALSFRNSAGLRDCSPESCAVAAAAAEQRSSDMMMDDPMTSREETANMRVDSKFLGLSQDENMSLTGLCNGEGSMSTVLPTAPNGHGGSYHHPAKGYKCKICQHVCFSRHDLSTHNATTHKQDPRPYRCDECGRQFSTCAYLSQHRRIHTGIKPYTCRFCNRPFTQLSHVQQHERIHTGEKPYRCTTCLKSFTQMSNLQSHQRQHMKGKPFKCEQCFMSFDTKEELDLHFQAKHSGNRYAKVLVCPYCNKSYNSETYLAKHVARHKEASATANSNNAESNSNNNNNNTNNNNNGNNNNTNVLNGMRAPTCVENMFSPEMAMAAAASALSRGNPMSNHNRQHAGLHHQHHHPTQPQVASAAAAAMAAAHAHQAAAAAAVAANSIRGDLETVQHSFFSTASDARGGAGGGSPASAAAGCDLLHNNPLNYSSMSEANLFHQLPVGIHSANAAHLAAAAAIQQQQQRLSHHHPHQQPNHQSSSSGRMSQLGATHFDEAGQHPNSGFAHSANEDMSPSHHNQQQQQQQHQYQPQHQMQHDQQQQQHSVPTHPKRQALDQLGDQNGRSVGSASHSSPCHPYNATTSGSPNTNEQQQLLNLTQHHSGVNGSKRVCPTQSVSPPLGTDRFGGATAGQLNNSAAAQHLGHTHRAQSMEQQQQQSQQSQQQQQQPQGQPRVAPPPAHQHCLQPMDPTSYATLTDRCGAFKTDDESMHERNRSDQSDSTSRPLPNLNIPSTTATTAKLNQSHKSSSSPASSASSSSSTPSSINPCRYTDPNNVGHLNSSAPGSPDLGLGSYQSKHSNGPNPETTNGGGGGANSASGGLPITSSSSSSIDCPNYDYMVQQTRDDTSLKTPNSKSLDDTKITESHPTGDKKLTDECMDLMGHPGLMNRTSESNSNQTAQSTSGIGIESLLGLSESPDHFANRRSDTMYDPNSLPASRDEPSLGPVENGTPGTTNMESDGRMLKRSWSTVRECDSENPVRIRSPVTPRSEDLNHADPNDRDDQHCRLANSRDSGPIADPGSHLPRSQPPADDDDDEEDDEEEEEENKSRSGSLNMDQSWSDLDSSATDSNGERRAHQHSHHHHHSTHHHHHRHSHSNSLKRRRRHHYVPQHLPTPDQHRTDAYPNEDDDGGGENKSSEYYDRHLNDEQSTNKCLPAAPSQDENGSAKNDDKIENRAPDSQCYFQPFQFN